ncbi:MAG: hypothetical protein KKE17_04370 [Proteobacteria bacterium]|nr:hypothetical protein [Pseudomonadota bacterium]MBU1709221.1 hypothetical protein [Pseudomonadota bacterium]
MESATIFNKKVVFIFVVLFFSQFLMSGCAELDFSGPNEKSQPEKTAEKPVAGTEPYYPSEFKDLLIPGELEWNRENSIVIQTSTYSGGILNFTGRVEINSLTDFFINTMKKTGWEMTGSIKAKDVMLAFIKPDNTCIIRIIDSGYGRKTSVYAYITKVK